MEKKINLICSASPEGKKYARRFRQTIERNGPEDLFKGEEGEARIKIKFDTVETQTEGARIRLSSSGDEPANVAARMIAEEILKWVRINGSFGNDVPVTDEPDADSSVGIHVLFGGNAKETVNDASVVQALCDAVIQGIIDFYNYN